MFGVTQLTGFGAGGVAIQQGPFLVGHADDTVDSATRTYPAVAVGDASARKVLILIHGHEGSGGANDVSYLRVGGVDATKRHSQSAAGGTVTTWTLPWSGGGTEVVTVGQPAADTVYASELAVFAVDNLVEVPAVAGGTLLHDPMEVPINVVEGQVVTVFGRTDGLGGVFGAGRVAGFTQEVDVWNGEAAYTAGSEVAPATVTPKTFTVDADNFTRKAMVALAWDRT